MSKEEIQGQRGASSQAICECTIHQGRPGESGRSWFDKCKAFDQKRKQGREGSKKTGQRQGIPSKARWEAGRGDAKHISLPSNVLRPSHPAINMLSSIYDPNSAQVHA